VGAIAIGPMFLVAGYSLGLVFASAAIFYVICSVFAVPLFVVGSGRLRYLVWQLGVASLTLSVIGDDIRSHAILRSEIPRVAFVFWALGTLSSSPVPICFLLMPMTRRRRFVAGTVLAAVALALWIGIKRIAG
jgi:hypothetical protein